MRSTLSGARRAAISSGARSRSTSASGFSRSLAILATNLLGATPTEQVRRSSSRTAARIDSAILRAPSKSSSDAVTSMNASSSDSGSISGEKRSKIARIARDASVYLAKSGFTTAACGQSRIACDMGIALRQPNTRAS